MLPRSSWSIRFPTQTSRARPAKVEGGIAGRICRRGENHRSEEKPVEVFRRRIQQGASEAGRSGFQRWRRIWIRFDIADDDHHLWSPIPSGVRAGWSKRRQFDRATCLPGWIRPDRSRKRRRKLITTSRQSGNNWTRETEERMADLVQLLHDRRGLHSRGLPRDTTCSSCT